MTEFTTSPSADAKLAGRAVRKVLATLSPDDLNAVAAGLARVELRDVEAQPDPDQLKLYPEPTATASPDAVRPRRNPVMPVPDRAHGLDIAAAVARINELSTPSAVEEYLRDPCFTAPVLKQIARALGPTVLATGRTKAEVRRDIVAGTVGFRSRSAAMSGGAWT